MDIQLVGKHQSGLVSEIFKAKADVRQFANALRVIITGDEFGTLPNPTELMQPATQGCRRHPNAALHIHLCGKRCATPACPTPAVNRRRTLEQCQKRAAQRRRQRAGAMGMIRIRQAIQRARAISFDDAINARARAEQDGSDLCRRKAGGAQQEYVQGQEVAVASAADLKEHLFLLRARNVNYGQTRHSAYSMIDRMFDNYRNIKEQLTVPTSCSH